MKIIQIIPRFGLGGAEIMCENLLYQLNEQGHVTIGVSLFDYQSSITERLEEQGIDIRFLGKKLGIDLSMIQKLKQLFTEEKPDVIHTHINSIQYAIPAALLAKIPVCVHTVHNVASKEQTRIGRIISGFFFRTGITIPVALSELIQDSIAEEYHLMKDKIPVVYNGIDLEKCHVKRTYALNGSFKILHIGRFSKQKNHNGLLRAFAAFIQEYPDAKLYLIGEGELRKAIELLTAELALTDSVHFLGARSNVFFFCRMLIYLSYHPNMKVFP